MDAGGICVDINYIQFHTGFNNLLYSDSAQYYPSVSHRQ